MTDTPRKTRGLGRGLSALMADVTPQDEAAPATTTASADIMVSTDRLKPNPQQPRRQFGKDDLDDLAASIRKKGVLQPLIVRPKGEDMFEIVAGERRWRAAQLAQVHEVPVLVRDFDDSEVLEVAIIENIQRANLNPIEEAAGFRQLMDRFGHTQEKLAEALGKSRSHIANLLRLLALPAEVRELVEEGTLSAGHARALITSDDPLTLARQVVRRGLSVRATEALVKKQQEPGDKPEPDAGKRKSAEKDADTVALEGDLAASLGMAVTLDHPTGQEAGAITIRYKTLDDLDTLCRLLSGS